MKTKTSAEIVEIANAARKCLLLKGLSQSAEFEVARVYCQATDELKKREMFHLLDTE